MTLTHPDWLFEIKHDGFRALAYVQTGARRTPLIYCGSGQRWRTGTRIGPATRALTRSAYG